MNEELATEACAAPIDSRHLLEAARTTWAQTRQEFRDNAVRTGHLLHRFIKARLLESVGLSERQRFKKGCTRRRAVHDAAVALGISRKCVVALVQTAMVVHLLCPDGNLGTLSHTALKALCPLVRRKSKGTDRNVAEMEEWVPVKLCNGREPRSVFAQAVREGWNRSRCHEETRRGALNDFQKENKSQSVHEQYTDADTMSGLLTRAKTCTMKDLADLILQLVNACPERAELLAFLQEKLAAEARRFVP
jgi:hypothetical protein